MLEEIRADLKQAFPMQRLCKAMLAVAKPSLPLWQQRKAIDSGYQAALMAPTEILAEQHFRKVAGWLEPLGVKTAWLTGSLKKKRKSARVDCLWRSAAGDWHPCLNSRQCAILQTRFGDR